MAKRGCVASLSSCSGTCEHAHHFFFFKTPDILSAFFLHTDRKACKTKTHIPFMFTRLPLVTCLFSQRLQLVTCFTRLIATRYLRFCQKLQVKFSRACHPVTSQVFLRFPSVTGQVFPRLPPSYKSSFPALSTSCRSSFSALATHYIRFFYCYQLHVLIAIWRGLLSAATFAAIATICRVSRTC